MAKTDTARTVALLGTADTKGAEMRYLAELLHSRGLQTVLIDAGIRQPTDCRPDVSNAVVAAAAHARVEDLAAAGDRGEAMRVMTAGARAVIAQCHGSGTIDGVLGLGGSGGTSLVAAAFRQLPIGFPKVLISTLASGDVGAYVGTSDLVMIPSLADLAGLNRISRVVLSNAADAIAGMVTWRSEPDDAGDRPLVGISMFANTMKAALEVTESLAPIAEVIPFHGTRPGGEALESLAAEGFLQGVIDLTLSGISSELLDASWAARPDRLRVWSTLRTPVVVAPGALDMAVFVGVDRLPPDIRTRKRYMHNDDTALVAITGDEAEHLGREIGARLQGTGQRCVICVPTKGFSEIGSPGGPFYDPAIPAGFLRGVRSTSENRIIEVDAAINDSAFAATVGREFAQLLERAGAPA